MSIHFKNIERPVRIVLVLLIAVLINIVCSFIHFSFDLTEDKKFTLTQATKNTLHKISDAIYVRVLLEGEFPAGFKRLQEGTKNILYQFSSENGYIEYTFENPNEGTLEEVNSRREILAKEGLNPVNLRIRSGTENSEQLIYPYAIFNLGERKIAISLLENIPELDQEQNLNNSISQLEYKFSNAIDKLIHFDKKNIVLTSANDELNSFQTKSLESLLRPFYYITRLNLDTVYQIKQEVHAIIVAKPLKPFSERNKFILDQYLMNGGKIMWFVDGMKMNLDSLISRNEFIPEPLDLNLSDLFFKYGVRIEPSLVLDLECARIPQVIGKLGDKPQIELFPWYYYPVPAPVSNHPIVNNTDRIFLDFPSHMDTVKTKYGVEKTALISSSKYSRYQLAPTKVGFDILRYKPDPDKFNKPHLIMGICLEGVFASNYENRLEDGMLNSLKKIQVEYQSKSSPTKMIIVTDGDVIRNNYDEKTEKYSNIGYNRYDKIHYNGNKEFLLNALEYLTNEENILEARSKQYKIRLLDFVRIDKERSFWQWLNVGLPLFVLFIFGMIHTFLRKKRYTKNY